MDKRLTETIKEAQKQYADFLNDMKASGRIEDNAFDMYLLLKDIAGDGYSYETIQECARTLISKIEEK